MIVGLNGYATCGKDEVAKIIQMLDTGWKIKKFSRKLKAVSSLLTGLPEFLFEEQDFKKTLLGKEWDNISVRDFLQRLGTDAIRNNIHPNAWVNALMSEYKPIDDRMSSSYPNWIITDCRFPNEAEAIKDRNGIVVRINRPGVGPVNNHYSEVALDGWDFDFIINNAGDINFLTKSVEELIKMKL